MTKLSSEIENSPTTLEDVLYANTAPRNTEQEWVTLVESIAAGDQLALHALYQRSHRVVFTLIMRITANRETAEEVTIDVFHDIWRRALHYDAVNGTVLGWIMNQARSRAIDRLRFESRKKRSPSGDMQTPADVVADPLDVVQLRDALSKRARGNRNDVLRWAYACRSGVAVEPAAWHHQDAHSFRTAQAAG
jgi:RNA polymerase sigma-70 factor (ECF subfamily)